MYRPGDTCRGEQGGGCERVWGKIGALTREGESGQGGGQGRGRVGWRGQGQKDQAEREVPVREQGEVQKVLRGELRANSGPRVRSTSCTCSNRHT